MVAFLTLRTQKSNGESEKYQHYLFEVSILFVWLLQNVSLFILQHLFSLTKLCLFIYLLHYDRKRTRWRKGNG